MPVIAAGDIPLIKKRWTTLRKDPYQGKYKPPIIKIKPTYHADGITIPKL